jgi:RNA polymerase sigma-70 factor, ECF subfamily
MRQPICWNLAGSAPLFVATDLMSLQELDEVTVARAQRGDRDAFRALVVMYQRPVHALIGRVLIGRARHSDVEDLAQETFLRVYRALPDFEPRGPGRLAKWILTIATRLAVDELRRARTVPVSQVSSDHVAGQDRADGALERRALGSAIIDAIESLTPEHRAVFVLREFHDFDYQEIAAALDLEVGTVKSRLARGRALLQNTLRGLHHG